MIIVGVTGSIANGKTTFAKYLAVNSDRSAHWESWQLIAEVANRLRQESPKHPDPADIKAINAWLQPLPAILEQTVHKSLPMAKLELTAGRLAQNPHHYTKLLQYLELIQLAPELAHVEITEDVKEALRSLLQWLGGYSVALLGEGVWYDEILRHIQASPNVNLATIGGVRFPGEAIRIQAAGGWILGITRANLAARHRQDLTERQQARIATDSTIYNNGDLNQLQRCANQVYADLYTHKLAKNYQAATF